MRICFLFLFLVSCGGGDYFQGLHSERESSLSSFPDSQELKEKSGNLEREEFLLNNERALVDFLFVADATESMLPHLSELGHSFSDLFFFIPDYDWQLSITSVDHGDHNEPKGMQQDWRDYMFAEYGRFGNLMNFEDERGSLNTKILSPKISDYENVFFHTLSHKDSIDCARPPHCSPPLEQPLRSLKSSLERANFNNSAFFRPTADLVVLYIGNEGERLEDQKRATKPLDVLQTFQDVFGHLDKKLLVFNILVKDEDCLQEERKLSPSASIGYSLMELADRTGGENISICKQDYGKELRKISKHIKSNLQNSILLKKKPVLESLVVEFSGKPLDWELSGQTIVFDKKDLSSESIEVQVFYESWD